MPLPWKMVKGTRLSQLANDHLHRSQKRRDGSSLFVETGFPTSLVDLFIKNREKLKKSSKKKKLQTTPNPIPEFRDRAINEITVISPLITGSPPRSPRISVIGRSIDGLDETGVDANTILMVVLKMFLVVVLALGTKRLTVGITISAFLLFLLEYVGKHSRSVLMPFKSALQSVLRLLRFKDVSIRKMEQESEAADCEIRVLDEIIQVDACYEKTQTEEVAVAGEEESNELKRISRKAKIKSKMKKLVPKKLRCSRKEHVSKRAEEVEDNSIFLEVRYKDDRELDNTSESSSSSRQRYNGDDDHELSESFTRREVKQVGIESWRYLFVCVIVLAGLIGGRVLAVIVTLSWFLMLKTDGKLLKYMMKVPRNFVKFSFTLFPDCLGGVSGNTSW